MLFDDSAASVQLHLVFTSETEHLLTWRKTSDLDIQSGLIEWNSTFSCPFEDK